MAKKKEPEEKAKWELRKGRKTWVLSPVPYCGYSESTRRSLRLKGYKFYKDDKLVSD